MTPLDQAHAAMENAPDDDALRLRFYERLAACELFLLLKDEASDGRISPVLLSLDGVEYVLAFDSEARLAEFTGQETPFAAMSGRQVVAMLAANGAKTMGLGLNLEVAPSSILLPPDAVLWLRDTLLNVAEEAREKPVELTTPFGVDESLVRALDAKFAAATGLADCAYLAGVRYDGGRKGVLLAIVAPLAGAEGALRQAALEVVSFSHRETAMDITFLPADDPMIARLGRVGLRFDLPRAEATIHSPKAPGMDPDNPPKLR